MKEAGNNELTTTAKKLLSEDKLFECFSHLMDHGTATNVVMEGTRFDTSELLTPEEHAAAKQREQLRFDKLTGLTLTVCLNNIETETFFVVKMANF